MPRRTDCRSCRSGDLVSVLDLGEQHLSDFREDDSRPSRYPLHLVVCGSCGLVQLDHTAPSAELYHGNYSFKSGVSDGIRADLADVVRSALDRRPDARTWLDVASNDGTLLSYVPPAVHRVGIDPLEQFAAEAREHADQVITDFFRPSYFGAGDRFDVVTSVSMFYDLDDPDAFVAGVAGVLAPRGVWVVQQNYLPAMLDATSVDNVSHEHLAYYSLTTLSPLLERHGLRVNHVTMSPVNGGCFRTVITRRDDALRHPSVTATLLDEERRGLRDPELAVYARFAARARERLHTLYDLVDEVVEGGESVYVYGASTRGGTLWQAAGLTPRHLPFVVDRNPAKVGRWMSALGSPIISEEDARERHPEYMLVGPWWFRDVFLKREADYLRSGGKLIFPLPDVDVVGVEVHPRGGVGE